MAANHEATLTPQNVTFNAAGETETIAFDVGSASDRLLEVFVAWRDRGNTMSVTYAGVSMTAATSKLTQGTLSVQLFTLANPTSGSNNIAVTASSGSNSSVAQISARVTSGADQTTPYDTPVTAQNTTATANTQSATTLTTGATGDRSSFWNATINGAANLTATPTNYTERGDNSNGSGISTEFGDADGAASITGTATWSNSAISVSWIAVGININASGGGAQTLTPPTVASGSSLFIPSVAAGAVTLLAAHIASAASVFAVALSLNVATPHRASTASTFAPSVAPGAVTLSAPHRASTATITAPSVASTLTAAHRSSTAALFAPTVAPGAVALTSPFIASGSSTFSSTVTPGAVTVYPPPIGAPAPVATLWVHPVFGDDSRSKATVAGSGGALPWATIGRAAWGSTTRSSPNAAEAADAGDVVHIAGGTYNYSSAVSGRFNVCYSPVNEGTVGNPITFFCASPVVLTGSSAAGPAIGSTGRDYVTWQGPFTIDETDWLVQADTGPVVLHDATGCVLDGLILHGIQVAYNDNNPAIRLETATSCEVRNCVIDGFYKSSPDNHNGCCIQLYGSQSCLIEQNTGTNSAAGVFFKDTNTSRTQHSNTVRYNLFDGVREVLCFSIVSNTVADDRNFVYGNIGLNGSNGITMLGSTNDHIYCNTFVDMSVCGFGFNGAANIEGASVWNNLYINCFRVLYGNGTTMLATTDVSHQHHLVYNYTGFYEGSDGNRTLSDYLTQYPTQDTDSPASVDSDPLFVGTGNYRLQSGSPARNLGRHPLTGATLHAGAYQSGYEQIGAPTSTQTSVVFAPTVAPGAITLVTPHRASTLSVFAPTVAAAGNALAAPHITSTISTFAPTLTAGAVSLTAPHVGATATVSTPTVRPVVTAPHIASAASTFGPMLRYAITTAHRASTAVVTAPMVAGGLITPSIGSTVSIFVPAVSAGAVTLSAPHLSSSAASYGPTVLPAGNYLGTSFLASGTVVRVPSVSAGPVSLSLPVLSAGTTVHAPTVFPDQPLSLPSIGATSALFAPSLALTLSPPTLAATSAVYVPSAAAAIATATRGSSAQVFTPTVIPGAVSLSIPHIATSSVVRSPRVQLAGTFPENIIVGTVEVEFSINSQTLTMPLHTVTFEG